MIEISRSVFQYNLAIMLAFDALCPLGAFLIAAFFYAERKESILRSNRLSMGLHVGNFSNVRVSETSERPKVFHGLELTDRFSYGPLLLQPRYNATSFRATPSGEHRQVAHSRRDKEPRVLPIRTSDTAV